MGPVLALWYTPWRRQTLGVVPSEMPRPEPRKGLTFWVLPPLYLFLLTTRFFCVVPTGTNSSRWGRLWQKPSQLDTQLLHGQRRASFLSSAHLPPPPCHLTSSFPVLLASLWPASPYTDILVIINISKWYQGQQPGLWDLSHTDTGERALPIERMEGTHICI
jgi:hypothetical protein